MYYNISFHFRKRHKNTLNLIKDCFPKCKKLTESFCDFGQYSIVIEGFFPELSTTLNDIDLKELSFIFARVTDE